MKPNSPIYEADTDPAARAIAADNMLLDLIDIKEAAEILGVHVRTVRRWVKAGKMPERTKRGRQMRFGRAGIAAMAAAMSKGGQP